jgi:hypothetical protein
MPAFICSGVALAIWSRAEAGDRYSTMNLVISSPLSGRNCPSGPIWANEMPGAMVQLASCGNIFVLISSSEGHQVTSAMRIPPQQRPARHHLRREQPDGAPRLKPEDMSDIADVSTSFAPISMRRMEDSLTLFRAQ